jgi:aspartate aminotransferase
LELKQSGIEKNNKIFKRKTIVKIARRVSRLGTENAFNVIADIIRLKEEGKNIINFCPGEPDFPTSINIKNAAYGAIKNNQTHYGPAPGLTQLRKEIAKYISRTRNIEVEMEEVVVTPGAKPILYHSIFALINKGDEVIYPNPGFAIYESVINFVGGKAIPLPLLESRDFSCDIDYLKKIVTAKTKMIILNSPQNPTGGILSKSDLKAIAEIAIKNDLWVLSDEIYSRIIYNGTFNSIASIKGMKERTIIMDGFSKTYSMTGWRIGYGVINKELAEIITKIIINSESCTATFTQIAAIEALTGPQEEVDKMVNEFKERRDLIVKGLNDIEGINCLVPMGAFYVFPNVTKVCHKLKLESSYELQQLLLKECSVALLARNAFGPKNSGEKDEYLRLAFTTSKDDIREGIKRIKNFIEKN